VIEFTNLAEFNRGLDAFIEECEELADGVMRGLVIEAFEFILQGTPEWSGELAANWRITVGAPASGYSETIFKERPFPGPLPEPYSRVQPNEAALNFARSISREALPLIHVGAQVFISNPTPYAMEVEENRDHRGQPFIRGINLPIEMVSVAADKFGAKGVITEIEAHRLAQEKL
jgi:hypothetical protein